MELADGEHFFVVTITTHILRAVADPNHPLSHRSSYDRRSRQLDGIQHQNDLVQVCLSGVSSGSSATLVCLSRGRTVSCPLCCRTLDPEGAEEAHDVAITGKCEQLPHGADEPETFQRVACRTDCRGALSHSSQPAESHGHAEDLPPILAMLTRR